MKLSFDHAITGYKVNQTFHDCSLNIFLVYFTLDLFKLFQLPLCTCIKNFSLSFFFMPPRSKIGGHIVFVLSVILSFHHSVILFFASRLKHWYCQIYFDFIEMSVNFVDHHYCGRISDRCGYLWTGSHVWGHCHGNCSW